MLIDNEKFIALLADNSGIEKEKVEKYLEELISEMKSSFDEGEGYEVEGFGIFSKLGSNILFIPSDELETEINYKYVGMEPIELPGGAQQQEPEEPEEDDENPIQGILDGGKTEESEEYEDPFAELFNEAEEHEKAENEQAEKGDLSEEEIEAVVEEEIESEDTEEIISEEPEKEEEPEEILEDSVKDIFGSDETEEETEEEEEPEPEEESAPGPEKWGIDAHKEEEQEGAFSGLLGDVEEEPELIDEDDIFATEEEIASEDDVFESEDEVSQEETDEEIDFSALDDDSSDEDFDDPFDELIEEEGDDKDFVPVVTNVSSGKASKKEADEDKEEGEDEKTSRTPKSPRDRKQSSPVFLYMILALVLLGGTGYLLAYFGVVNIEGITPSSASTQVAQSNPQVTPPESTPPQTTDTEEEQPVKEVPTIEANNENAPNETEESIENSSDDESGVTEEETPQNQENDIAPLVADEKAPGDGGIISPVNIQEQAEVYGLNGTATEAGNNGYTIVLYTLSRKSGADAQFEKLSKDGFRVIIKETPSQEFGRLYRVSIGQFESLADAAIAAEKVDSEVLGNYIITKI